ncbi:MAG: hypothetical protein M1442_02505 [Candidatus Thermoplasmatota archaeon]|nr:hypothetical protein [Candidatus Thermoplasmatota archaeon]
MTDERLQYLSIDEMGKIAPEDDNIHLELMEHKTASIKRFDDRHFDDIFPTVFDAANGTCRMRRKRFSRFLEIERRERTE